MKKLGSFILASAFALMSGAALAAPVTNNTGIAAPTSTITFSEVALSSGDVVTNQYASYGATFSPFATFRPQDGFFATDYIGNFFGPGGATASPLEISFSGTVSGAAFEYISNGGNSLFEALLNGSVVDSFSAATSTTTGIYYGFDGISFDTIRVTAPGNAALELDNLQFRANAPADVPEPGSLFLVSAGLAGVWLRKRRQS